MKPLKIIFILPSFAGGGAEKVTISLYNNLYKLGHNTRLIIQNNSGPLSDEIINKKFIDLKSDKFRYSIIKLIKNINRFKPDIVFSTFPHITLPLIFLRDYFYKNTKIVSREPNMRDISFEHSSYPKILKFLSNKYSNKCNKIIVTSKAMKMDFINTGVDEILLNLIYNPIDVAGIRKIKVLNRHAGKGLRFIIVGRLVYQKGIDRVLPLLKSLNNCHLTIIGEGPDKDKLKKQSFELNINNKVKFMNFTQNAKSYIAGSDYLLLPSRWEGLPNVVLESLALGTPVISLKEIISLKDLIPFVKENSLKLCKNIDEINGLMEKLHSREDFIEPKIRKNLLLEYNSPIVYAKKIEKIFKEVLIAE